MVQKVLMVAFHYPPYEGGSGVHRTLKFSRYLPDNGWQPIVLTAHPRAYARVGVEQLRQIPPEVVVRRAFALDTARHLSICGRYSRLMALPDPWISWWMDAVRIGLRIIRHYKPRILWSTYPIATAHLIGLTLHRLTGIPWVADFRDSMTEDDYPRDLLTRRSYLWIERQTVKYASRLVFTAPTARQMYLNRYSQLDVGRCALVPNGYDEDDFVDIHRCTPPHVLNGRAIRLLHAGVIYTDERDPRAFFRVVARLKNDGIISRDDIVIDLRASGSEAYYGALLKELCIDDIVRLLPPVPYRKALQDCGNADALVLFQAGSCNHQIPAKAYEYLRLRKPVLALTPPAGDTAKLLEEVGGATVVDIGREDEMYKVIPAFLNSVRNGNHTVPSEVRASRYSRKFQTHQLSTCLSEVLY